MYSENDNFDEEEQVGSGNKLLDFYQENKKMVFILLGALLLLIILLMLSSCSKNGGNNNPNNNNNKVPIVQMLPEVQYVELGKSVIISASLTNWQELGIYDPEFKWISSNSKVATVDSLGNVTGVGYGEATITATYIHTDKKTYPVTCKVTVGDGNPNVTLTSASFMKNEYELLISLNETYDLKKDISIYPENAYINSEEFLSSDTSIVSVDNDGKIIAKSEGEATITATLNSNITAKLVVNVTSNNVNTQYIKLIQTIAFNNAKETLKIGEKKQIDVSYLPSDAYRNFVKWRSNDTTVATVDNDGLVTAISSGSTTIEVSSKNGISEKIVVEVLDNIVKASSLNIVSSTNISLSKGQTYQIVPNVLPENATDKTVRYDSSNIAIANVSINGLITAINCGNATIVVTTNDGGYSKPIYVTVNNCSSSSSSSGNSSGSNSSSGSSSGSSSSSSGSSSSSSSNKTIDLANLWSTPEKAKSNAVSSPFTVKVTMGSGVGYIKYCVVAYTNSTTTCTPNTKMTSSGNFVITGSGTYLVRATSYDNNGNVISSNSSFYKNGAFELYAYLDGGGSLNNYCYKRTDGTYYLGQAETGAILVDDSYCNSSGANGTPTVNETTVTKKIVGRVSTGLLGLGSKLNYWIVGFNSPKVIEKIYYCIGDDISTNCNININNFSTSWTLTAVYEGSSCPYYSGGERQRYQKLESGITYMKDVTNSYNINYNISGKDGQRFCIKAQFDDNSYSSVYCFNTVSQYGFIEGCE